MASKAASEFERLVSLVARLRAPGGCPWDRAQTLESLRPFVLEETYEVLQAIDSGDRDALREEIGDMIFEGVLLAQLCDEAGNFSLADSLASIADKLVRRHPHVFGEGPRAATAEEGLGRWQEAKASERAAETSGAKAKTLLGGVPKAAPALLRAYEIGVRAASVGFDWDSATDVLSKIDEEVAELREAVSGSLTAAGQGTVAPAGSGPGTWRGHDAIEEEMGDLLFAIANLARKLGVEPESALRAADDKFVRRFAELERRFNERGEAMKDAGLARLEEEWGRIKDKERSDE